MHKPALALAALIGLSACAVPFDDARFQQRQDALVDAELPRPTVAPSKPRLWYVGLGMQGETWSENDVVETADRLGQVAIGYKVVPILFSNRFSALPDRYPAVDGRSVEQAIAAIARHAAPADVVLVYASAHGNQRLLGRSAAGRPLAPVGVDELQRWLDPLRGHDTILILSACFSGSFIPPLQADHRIIFTAARADRTSFGCQAGAAHTVFGEALLTALSRPGESLHTIVDATRAAVSQRERAMGIRQRSEPQLSVGADMQSLYEAPTL